MLHEKKSYKCNINCHLLAIKSVSTYAQKMDKIKSEYIFCIMDDLMKKNANWHTCWRAIKGGKKASIRVEEK